MTANHSKTDELESFDIAATFEEADSGIEGYHVMEDLADVLTGTDYGAVDFLYGDLHLVEWGDGGEYEYQGHFEGDGLHIDATDELASVSDGPYHVVGIPGDHTRHLVRERDGE